MANDITTLIQGINASKTQLRDKAAELGLIGTSETPKLAVLADKYDTIEDQGSPTASIKEGETYTIQPGYYHGGTITGIAGGGDYDLEEKIVTPAKNEQILTPSAGYYGLSKVTVAAIPAQYQDVSNVTAAAGDVLTGKTIVSANGTSIVGTMPNNGAVAATLDSNTASYTVPAGYHTGAGTVSVSLEEKNVTPTKSVQNITPTNGKLLSKITVSAIPSNYVNIEDINIDNKADAATILAGKEAYSIDSAGNPILVEGTMANNGAVTATITGLTAAESVYTIPAGYHNGSGTVSLTDDIYNALLAI